MIKYRKRLLESIGITEPEPFLTHKEWISISRLGDLTDDFIREFNEDIYWSYLFLHQKISDDLLIEFEHRIDWTWYFLRVNSSFSIIKKYITRCEPDYLDQAELSHFSKLQLQEIQRILDFKNIFQNNKIKIEKTI
jgi:hypothetical protein